MTDISSNKAAKSDGLLGWAQSLKQSTLAWAGLALAAAILLSVNLFSATSLRNVRGDLTENSLFTISKGAKEILKSLDEPIDARVYFSKRLAEISPEHARYFERVRMLFEQYRDLSGGKLQVTFLDPEPFSDAEDKAVAAGLQGARLNTEGEVAYFGLVASNATDNTDTIPFFSPDRESYLEYDVTKLIYALANPKKRTVGLMTGLPLDGGKSPMRDQPVPAWTVMGQIREFFDVRTIEQDIASVPADLDVLMIAQPSTLSEKAAYAIDQYVLKGGKVLMFADPMSESAQAQLTQQQTTLGEGRKQLLKVLESWGAKIDVTKVAADIRNARRVQFGGGPEGMITEFVAWLGLGKANINQNDVLSAGVEVLNIASSGVIDKASGAAIELTPILETSADAMLVDAVKTGMGADPLGLLRDYKPGGKKLTLAARLSGEAKSAFPAGAPAEPVKPEEPKPAEGGAKPEEKPAEKPAEKKDPMAGHVASGKINVIVVADTDLLADQFWIDRRQMAGQNIVVPRAHNAAFVIGALENLSGNNSLIELRGRGVDNRPFTKVAEIRREAEKQFRAKEQALEKKLQTAQEELQKLQTSGEGGSVILSEKERQAAENFRLEMLNTRKELREVKRALRADIDRLDGWLKFANIALVPLALGFAGLGLAWRRTRQRAEASKS